MCRNGVAGKNHSETVSCQIMDGSEIVHPAPWFKLAGLKSYSNSQIQLPKPLMPFEVNLAHLTNHPKWIPCPVFLPSLSAVSNEPTHLVLWGFPPFGGKVSVCSSGSSRLSLQHAGSTEVHYPTWGRQVFYATKWSAERRRGREMRRGRE